MCKFKKYQKSNPRIDKCMRPLIKCLKREGYNIVACCCGHNKYPMTIIEKWKSGEFIHYQELITSCIIPRTRRFYKRDKNGLYFIPELLKK